MLKTTKQKINDWFTKPSTNTHDLHKKTYKNITNELIKDKPLFINLTEYFKKQYEERNLHQIAVKKRPTFLILKRLVILRKYKNTPELGILKQIT
jgi:hypothetical protein